MVLSHVRVAVAIVFLYCVARSSCGITAMIQPSVLFVSSVCLLLALCSPTVTWIYNTLVLCSIVML